MFYFVNATILSLSVTVSAAPTLYLVGDMAHLDYNGLQGYAVPSHTFLCQSEAVQMGRVHFIIFLRAESCKQGHRRGECEKLYT